MRWAAWVVPAALAMLALAAMPAAAYGVKVPPVVLGADVPVQFTGMAGDETVTVRVGPLTQTVKVNPADPTHVMRNLTAGLHTWAVTIHKGNATTFFSGEVHVDGGLLVLARQIAELKAAIAAATGGGAQPLPAGVETRLALLEAAIGRLEAQGAQHEQKRVEDRAAWEPALSSLVKRPISVTAPPAEPPVIEVAAPPTKPSTAGSMAVVVGILALAAVAVHHVYVRRLHRETLVMLLALGARAGLSAESPELARAQRAVAGAEPT
jgi:hypothetical protein